MDDYGGTNADELFDLFAEQEEEEEQDDHDDIDEDENSLDWCMKVKKAAPKITQGSEVGVGWKNYQLVQRIDRLTDLVHELHKKINHED